MQTEVEKQPDSSDLVQQAREIAKQLQGEICALQDKRESDRSALQLLHGEIRALKDQQEADKRKLELQRQHLLLL